MNTLGTSTNVTNMNTVAASIEDVNRYANEYSVSASAPTTDVSLGDMYFDTTLSKLKIYSNIGWEDAGSRVNGTSRRQSFTATEGQTSFPVSGGFDFGFVDVYLDGVKLHTSDFTDTSGTAIVLASGAAVNQLVDIIAYGTFSLGNIVVGDISDVTSTATELNYVDGVTSAIQTQIDTKLPLSGGTLTGDLDVSGIVYGDSGASGNLVLKSTSGNTNHSAIEIGTILNSDNGGISFSTAGIGGSWGPAAATTRMRISGTTGNVGIGSSAPLSKLIVTNNGYSGHADWAFTVDSKTVDATSAVMHLRKADASSVMYVRSDGNVGIGTSSIDGTLHIDAGTSSDIIIEKDGGGGAAIRFHNDGSQLSYIQLDGSEDMVYYGASGVNQIIYAGGYERMRIRSDGNVEMGGNLTISGKNVPKVFNQNAAPTSGFSVGDIWYDDDDDIVSIAGNVSGTLQWIGV